MSDLLVCFFTGCIYYYFFRSIHSLIKWFHTLNTDYIQIWPSVASLDNCGVNKLIRGEINLSMEQHVYFSTVFLFLNVEKTSLHISPLQDFIRNRNPSFDRSGGNCKREVVPSAWTVCPVYGHSMSIDRVEEPVIFWSLLQMIMWKLLSVSKIFILSESIWSSVWFV